MTSETGCPCDRMTQAVLQRQDHDFVLGEVVFGQLHLAVEDGDQVLRFELLRLRVRPVALQAQRVRRLGAQQMIVVSTMRLWQVAHPCSNAG